MTEQSGLTGTAAIVTGSAQNIGRAIALVLAEAGAAVLINARNSADAAQGVADEINQAGGKAIVHLADVSQPDQVDGMVEAAVASFGRLDILVNNVAARMAMPITETTYEDWRHVHSNTLDAAFLCCRAAVPHLARHGRGAIVNIGGVSGHAGVANRSAVAAAKAGLAGMTGSLAVELAPRGVTVNCVSPGYIDTHLPGHVPAHFAQKPVPAGRIGTKSEVAAMVGFLCGPDGRYVTGQTIHVAGGWHITIS
jgi:3-oxoacyl-[acyl-carrier protein] reductase